MPRLRLDREYLLDELQPMDKARSDQTLTDALRTEQVPPPEYGLRNLPRAQRHQIERQRRINLARMRALNEQYQDAPELDLETYGKQQARESRQPKIQTVAHPILDKPQDTHEQDYINAKRGTVSDSQLADDIKQFRAIKKADEATRAEDEATLSSEPQMEAPQPPELATEQQSPIEMALKDGYTKEEINSYLDQKVREAKEAGYTDEQIKQFITDDVIQQLPFNETKIRSTPNPTENGFKSPSTFTEALKAGWGWSTPGLGVEVQKGAEGKLPEFAVNDTTPLPYSAVAAITGAIAEIPTMVTGGVMGSSGGPITGAAGAVALPMALRRIFVDDITRGQINSKSEFMTRLWPTLWETAKGWMTGAVTGVVGSKTAQVTAGLPGGTLITRGMEAAALTEVSSRLEGQAPSVRSFVDNAVLLGVMHYVLPEWAVPKPPNIIHGIYEKTGVSPEQVRQDALKGDKNVWQDVLDGRIPDAYKGQTEAPPPPPTQAERATFKVKPSTPEEIALAKSFMDQPFAEIPQMPNEPSRPEHINYNYIQTSEDVKQSLSRLSEVYTQKINEQRRAPRTWPQSQADAAQVLADVLNSDPASVSTFLEGKAPGPSTTAELLARKELVLGFTEDLMRSRAALEVKGDKATPEEIATFLSQVERVSNVHAAFLGKRADVGRALNALKSTGREAERSQAILDVINSYGGAENMPKLVKMLGELDSPQQVAAFAKQATKASTWDMVVEAWKAGLVSGLRTNEVNFLSTAAFTTLRLPTEAMAAVYGKIGSPEERVAFSEIPARALGMMAGLRDGAKIAGAILRTGENIYGAKTEQYEPKIPGKLGETVRTPFRLLASSDAMLKSVNERGELYALATRQAIDEGKTIGTPGFFNRIVEIVKNPTEEQQAQAKDAGMRYTFNKPLGKGGQAFSRMVKEWHLEWLFPFITTPGNIFKETARMTPGANLAVKEWRADYEAGGVRRDRALAEVSVGASIVAMVIGAASEGMITGNGNPDKGVRATDRAAGWKPYAVKINGQYVDGYLRMAPIGPLIGLTADAHEMWNYMNSEERSQVGRMLAFSIAQNVTNQTFMTGMTNMVNVLQDPSRYGQNYFESLAASVVPSVIGQTAQEMDPLVREIHGIKDALQARVPWQRQGLMPQKDLFGEPIKNPERLWWGSPFSVTPLSTDKVRTEASRLGFATPIIPTKLDVIPSKDFNKLDKVLLTPEQRDGFNTRSGQLAYQLLKKEIYKPSWDQQPDIVKRMIFEKIFKGARELANKELLAGSLPAVEEAERKVEKALGKEPPL